MDTFLVYFQIYIVDRQMFCLDAYLGNEFSDFIVILHEYELAYEDSSYEVRLYCTNWK